MIQTLNITDWYMKILNPLSTEIKLNLIHRLSESVLKEGLFASSSKTSAVKSDFFASLSDAWDDGVTPEKETRAIRENRMSGISRHIDSFE